MIATLLLLSDLPTQITLIVFLYSKLNQLIKSKLGGFVGL